MGKIVTRTIIVICMLIGLPTVFNIMDRAQPILLEALPRIIIGKNTTDNSVLDKLWENDDLCKLLSGYYNVVKNKVDALCGNK